MQRQILNNMAICPVCGGWITRVEGLSASGAGKISYSGCCLIGLDLLDKWETVKDLPEKRRQKMIDKSRAKFVAWQKRNIEEYEAGASQRGRARQILHDAARENREDDNTFSELYGPITKDELERIRARK